MKGIKEADIKDKRGNLVISPGLKVRHKKSQFEYTVDSVVKDKSGKTMVLLKRPDAPRFDSVLPVGKPMSSAILGEKLIYEAELIDDFSTSYYVANDDKQSPQDLVAVSADEFEKEYEVR